MRMLFWKFLGKMEHVNARYSWIQHLPLDNKTYIEDQRIQCIMRQLLHHRRQLFSVSDNLWDLYRHKLKVLPDGTLCDPEVVCIIIADDAMVNVTCPVEIRDHTRGKPCN